MSTPNIGIPKREKDSAWGMEKYMYAQREKLSPPQCPANIPEPANVARPMMNGRLPGKTFKRAL